MQKRFLFLSLGGLLAILALSVSFFWYAEEAAQHTDVVFLSVGEGDAILFSQGTNQVLIDSGRNSKVLLAGLGRHMPFWDRRIETIIATHPDADHIGGFAGLLKMYAVRNVLTTGAESNTEVSALFQEAVRKYTGGEPKSIFRGAKIIFPNGGELLIEYPSAPLPKETSEGKTNEGSIVARFVFGKTEMLFTGDLPQEEFFLPDEPPVTVLKVAHHGSKYSTSEKFLDRIRPKEAVISVGKNQYGHPALEVLERLSRRDIVTRRTDMFGDIIYRCISDHCVFAGS